MIPALAAAVVILAGANVGLVCIIAALCRSQDAMTKVLCDEYRRTTETGEERKPRIVGMYRVKEEDKS